MKRQSQFHEELRDLRADKACDFVLSNGSFTEWYRGSKSRQLVILGDLGCGKTVIMAYLIDEFIRKNKQQLPQPKVCYHYCLKGETDQAIHVVSVLILALLEQLPGLKKMFYDWYRQQQTSGNVEPATDKRKLEECFNDMVQLVDRPLFVVVDGLDECDRQSQTRLLDFLARLTQRNPKLKTLISCRFEEQILKHLSSASKIYLASDVKRDGLIVEHAVYDRLSFLPEDVKVLVVSTLTPLAQGSAIWTRMVIELIERRRVQTLHTMQDLLEGLPLPQNLSQVYEGLFLQCTLAEPENGRLADIALKLLAAARRPLSISELSWAVALAAAGERVTTVTAVARLVDCSRVLSFIYPFISRIDFADLRKRQVRLVHQSVREYIVGSRISHERREHDLITVKMAAEEHDGHAMEYLEAYILEICIRYLLLDEINHANIFSDEQLAIDALPQETDLFTNDSEPVKYDPYCTWEEWEANMTRYDPSERGFGEFFVYAASQWLQHFGAVKTGPLPDLARIETLCQARSVRLHNWIQQNCRPDCVIKPRFPFESELYDPLGIVSLYGSEAMLRSMLERSDFGKDYFLPETALRAVDQVLQWGDLTRLRTLLAHGDSRSFENFGFFQLIIKHWTHGFAKHKNWEVAFDVVYDVKETMVEEHWANELLCVAARAGCMPMVRRLMDEARGDQHLSAELVHEERRIGPDVSTPKKKIHQSVGEAIMGNHTDVVEYLLGQKGLEAHLKYVNGRGEDVFHLAADRCNPMIFRLIAPHFQRDGHKADVEGNTVFERISMSTASSQDRGDSRRILLSQSSRKASY